MVKKVVAFDLDGTLIDDVDVITDGFVLASKRLKLDIPRERLKLIFTYSEPNFFKRFYPKINQKTINEFKEIAVKYFIKNINQVRPFPGVIKVLKELKKKHEIIIISNTTYKLILEVLEAARLNPLFFDLIVGADLVKNSKPWPDELFLAKKIMHHKVDYFIGDAIADIRAGKKAKVKTIGLITTYTKKEDFEKLNPYKIINNIDELIDIIK